MTVGDEPDPPGKAETPAIYWRPAATVPSRRGRWGCVLLVGVVLAGLAAIYGFLFMQLGQMVSVPTERIAAEVSAGSSGRVFSTMYAPIPGGRGQFLFYVQSDTSEADATRIACGVVRPVLAREGYASSGFAIQSHGSGVLSVGRVLATDATPCP